MARVGLLSSIRSQVTFRSPLSRLHTPQQIKQTTRVWRLFRAFAIHRDLTLATLRFFRADGHVSETVSVALEDGKTVGGRDKVERGLTCSYANKNIELNPSHLSFPLLQRIQEDEMPGDLGLKDQDQVTREEKRDDGRMEGGETVTKIVTYNIFASPPPTHTD